ncbi:MAG: hypothetical protein IJA57_07535 [Alistipes sp.]|nr:hypothetical protein [Alistipes sp.]
MNKWLLVIVSVIFLFCSCAKRDNKLQEEMPMQGVVNKRLEDWQTSILRDLEEYYNSCDKRVYPLASGVEVLDKRLKSRPYWRVANYKSGRVVDGEVHLYYREVTVGGASRQMMHIRGDSVCYYGLFDDNSAKMWGSTPVIREWRRSSDDILFCSGDSIAIGYLQKSPEKELNIYEIYVLVPATRQEWNSFQRERERQTKMAEETNRMIETLMQGQ